MPAWLSYFRQHPWQRRLLTASLAVVLGGLAGLLAFPHVRDWMLLRDLGNRGAAVRLGAISRAIPLARRSPRTLARLEAALDGADDVQFTAIVAVLKRLGVWHPAERSPLHIDRAQALELAGNPSAETRRMFLGEMLLAGRDNPYVRQGLATSAKDPNGDVRSLAAALAARLGEDGALAALAADADPNVAAAAVLSAGIARRTALRGRLREMLPGAQDVPRQAAAAFALARIDPNGSSEAICALLGRADKAGQAALRDRLLHVVGGLGGPRAAAVVAGVVRRAREAGKHPPAMAIAAAGRLRLPDIAPDVRAILAAAVKPDSGLSADQVHAALMAAEALRLPVRRQVLDICDRLWTDRPGLRLMLEAAARALAHQATLPQGDEPNVPSLAECIRTLRRDVVEDFPPPTPPATAPTTAPATAPARPVRPTLLSAAAAVALWRLEGDFEEPQFRFIRVPAADDDPLAGDYISWHLGVLGSDREFRLGQEWLPALDAPPAQREYDNQRRSTGAMLLALAARTDDQRKLAAERIRSRLIGGRLGGEDNYFVAGSYQCALAILGDADAGEKVRELLETGEFHPRRAITALALVGRLQGLDWVLWNPQINTRDRLYLLVDELVVDVLDTCLPELPTVEPFADTDLAGWQLEILRLTYAIRRSSLRPSWPPEPSNYRPPTSRHTTRPS